MFQTVNPATGNVVQTYHYMTLAEVDRLLSAAQDSFSQWKRTGPSERAACLRRMARALLEHKAELSLCIHHEMGKNLSSAATEIEKSAMACEYFAAQAEELLAAQVVSESNYKKSFICFEPLGVILGIMPWNFPVWQFVRFAAPALLAGNVVVLKPADMTAGCGQKIEEILKPIFTQPLVFNMIADHSEVARFIKSPMVRGVSFTGSSRGGREVAKVAGEALKKCILELGGSDAYVVLSDANIEMAARACAAGRMVNNGQSCIAVKRVIVLRPVFTEFVQRVREALATYPMEPLAHLKFQSQIHEQVNTLREAGADIVLGGEMPTGVGAFYPPTLAVFEKDVPSLHEEEIFGPVLVVIQVNSEDEAFAVANQSVYGLGGGVFSRDEDRARELAQKKMEAGFVVVNDFVKSDPRLPFGGVKDSGYGRELSAFGVHEFANIKTVATGDFV